MLKRGIPGIVPEETESGRVFSTRDSGREGASAGSTGRHWQAPSGTDDRSPTPIVSTPGAAAILFSGDRDAGDWQQHEAALAAQQARRFAARTCEPVQAPASCAIQTIPAIAVRAIQKRRMERDDTIG